MHSPPDSVPLMNRWTSAIARSALSVAILALGGLGFYLMAPPEIPKQTPAVEPPPLVETHIAAEHHDGISFLVDGVVVPFREIQLAAQVAGRVQHKSENCRIGRTVKKGDLLLRIEPDDYELEVRRLNEELSQADAMIKELDAEILTVDNQIASSEDQLEIDQRQLRRNEDLLARKAASPSEVDEARRAELATRNTMQSQVDQKNLLTQRRIRMEAAKALVQANLDKAELSLSRTEIVSPLDGVVVNESVEQDSFVQPGNAMVTLQETSRLDVSCKLHMSQMNWLWQGMKSDANNGGYEFPRTPATVIYQLGDATFGWDAMADRYEGAGVDSQTRMVPCRVHVSDPTNVRTLSSDGSEATNGQLITTQSTVPAGDASEAPSTVVALDAPDPAPNTAPDDSLEPPTLMTGMYVKVRIHADPPVALVRLPQEAIQPGNTVWIVESEKLKQQRVTIALAESDYVVVVQEPGGIRAGDKVVVSPMARPVEGMAVSSDAKAYAEKLNAARKSGGPGGPGGRGPR